MNTLENLTQTITDYYPVKIQPAELNETFHIFRKLAHPQYVCLHQINGKMAVLTFFRAHEMDKSLKKHKEEHGIDFTIKSTETLRTLLTNKF